MLSKNEKTKLFNNGFVFLPSFQHEIETKFAFSSIGKIICIPGLKKVQTLKPRLKESSPPNIYSGNFGLEEFPLHTDLAHWYTPPRFFILRCIYGSSNISTYLLDSAELMEIIGIRFLERTLVKPRRSHHNQSPIMRVFDRRSPTTNIFRWDSIFIKPATEKSIYFMEHINELIYSLERKKLYLNNPGDTLLIDNWRMLHGRSNVPTNSKNRLIERSYLELVN